MGELATVCDMEGLDLDDQVIQQDGATCHIGNGNLEYLQQIGPHRLIFRYSDYPYPPRTSDLTPPDIWGILKDKSFSDPIPDGI